MKVAQRPHNMPFYINGTQVNALRCGQSSMQEPILQKQDLFSRMTRQEILEICRHCGQCKLNGNVWKKAQNNVELLQILLRKVKCEKKTKIIKASLGQYAKNQNLITLNGAVETELPNGFIIQHHLQTNFYKKLGECYQCRQQLSEGSCQAIVRISQKSLNLKTFYYIQQLIIKYNKQNRIIKCSIQNSNMQFQFMTYFYAKQFVQFLVRILPVVVVYQKVLSSPWQHQFSVLVPNINRNDLVLLPKKLAKSMGTSQLNLCYSVSETICLVNLSNYKLVELTSSQYQTYQNQIKVFSFSDSKSVFQVLKSNQFPNRQSGSIIQTICEYIVFRRNQWQEFRARGIMGELASGQLVKGYDLKNYPDIKQLCSNHTNLILVAKYEKDLNKKRVFKLKRLHQFGIQCTYKQKTDIKVAEFEDFMQEIQINAELRKQIKLFQANESILNEIKKAEQKLEIQICELFEDLNIEQKSIEIQKCEDLSEQLSGIQSLILSMNKVTIS